MVCTPRRQPGYIELTVRLHRAAAWAVCLAAVVSVVAPTTTVYAQRALPGEVHYRHRLNDTAPGIIGQQMLHRGGPIRGYFQPVELRAPQGAKIAVADGGHFQHRQAAPLTAGLLIGQVYRFQVTEIPIQGGFEVFPTIEVVNRLYPPEGNKWRFPIPVELTQEELTFALEGRYVTRVIYLEDPERALPLPEQPGFQRYFEISGDQDPLQAADRLGRPMAILRMGSRTPPPEGPDSQFLFGCPPSIMAPRLVSPRPADGAPNAGTPEDVTPRAVEQYLPGPQALLRNPINVMVSSEAIGR
jgi:hypothetical protein